MKHGRSLSISGSLFLLIMLILGMIVGPVSAAGQQPQHPTRPGSTSLDATVYLTTATLQPLFQDSINQQVPGAVSNAISALVNKLSATNQGWAKQMATTLIQPSATVTGLTPQKNGLATTLRLSLYPGDPNPTNISMLVQFSVLDASTIQVSAQPMNGSPTLVNGPLTTLHVPFGQLKNIVTTPTCGDAALALSLQFPISLNQGTTSTAYSQSSITNSAITLADIQENQTTQANSTTTNSYIEIPVSSLANLSIDSIPINGTFTAQNIQLAVQGHNLAVTSDIVLTGSSIKLATATTIIQPTASNGDLVLHILHTTLTVLIFNFQDDTYNTQIQQLLNSKLGNLLTNKFNVTGVAIGGNTHVPCAANDSLILTGTANLG